MSKYRINRSIPGGFLDSLVAIGTARDDMEGLPSFARTNPLLFDIEAIAESVVDHLRVWFPITAEIPGVARSQPITYSVVPVVLEQPEITATTKQSPSGRYQVFSLSAYRNYPDVVPAGLYDNLLDAIRHANSVTYAMGVVDSLAESRGLVYVNSEPDAAPVDDGLSPDAKSRMDAMVKQVLAAQK